MKIGEEVIALDHVKEMAKVFDSYRYKHGVHRAFEDLAKVLEPEIEKQHVQSVVFLKRWIRELGEEAEKLEFDVMTGVFADHFQETGEYLKKHEE